MLKLALTLRWIGALVLCLLLAVGFALMAQWQVGRTVIENAANDTWSKVESVKLTEITKPNAPFTFSEITNLNDETILTQVKTPLNIDATKAFLVSDRIQVNGDRGFWLVAPAHTPAAYLFVVVGFINNEQSAASILKKVRAGLANQVLGGSAQPVTEYVGRYLPPEAPVESPGGDIYNSLSIAQQINVTSFDSAKVYTGFMALTEDNLFSSVDGVELVTIGMAKSDSQVNWLSAFYAIEWTVFAGFAVFMWWRLLADAYKKQQTALLAE